jgi:bifunctional enzyme CysN/CysC
MNLVVTGHVDHGKSTILGRLLADIGALPDGRLERVRQHCARHAKPFEYAFLLDALHDEQAQGITIDGARVFFKTATREYIVIDAPGHVEFLRNMVTGAARAEAAFLVIDAHEGVQENSRRHGYLLSMLGIRQIAVLVNKMDLVGGSEAAFRRTVDEYSAFLARIGVTPTAFIPVSGATGDNIALRSTGLAWYRGPTMLDALESFAAAPAAEEAPFRMPVQDVYKFTADQDQRRIVAGSVVSGRVRVNDEVVFLPSGKRSRVSTIEGFNQAPQTTASAGQATGFTLTDQIYVTRGEMAVRGGDPMPHVSTRLRASVFWLGRDALTPGKSYVLKLGATRVTAQVETTHRVLDASTLASTDTQHDVERHQVADCTLVMSKPLAFDTADVLGGTSRFVLVDGHHIAGGGVIRDALPDRIAVIDAPDHQIGHSVSGAAETWSHGAAVVWLTGLSGSGKSTIGEALRDRLAGAGARVEYLDGDVLRAALPGTGFSREDRNAHVARIGFFAGRLEHHGVIVICALISPYEEARRQARAQCRRFIEVHVSTPIAECERRDPKGLYGRARRGELTGFTGIDDPYEMPRAADLTIDTRFVSVHDAVARIVATLERS